MKIERLISIISLASKGAFLSPINSDISNEIKGFNRRKKITLEVKNKIPEGAMYSNSSKLNRDAFRWILWVWDPISKEKFEVKINNEL